MAITGSGTAADPYIVHSYSEIHTVLDRAGGSGYYFNPYLKLANDIDCNDYGSSFVFNTFKSGNINYPFNFDLDGHTIKNISVSAGKYLFQGNGNSVIKNGKLLNIYATGCNEIIDSCKLEDISMSISAMNLANGVFACRVGGGTAVTLLNRCSIYVENLTKTLIDTWGFTAAITIAECDIFVKAGNIVVGGGYGGGLITTLNKATNCRFRGNVDSAYNSVLIVGQLDTCVVDISIPLTSSKYLFINTSGTTVYNKDIIGTSGQYVGVGCTTEQIRNGDSLRAKGFPVVNVSA